MKIKGIKINWDKRYSEVYGEEKMKTFTIFIFLMIFAGIACGFTIFGSLIVGLVSGVLVIADDYLRWCGINPIDKLVKK